MKKERAFSGTVQGYHLAQHLEGCLLMPYGCHQAICY